MSRRNGNTFRLNKKQRQKGDIRIIQIGKFTFTVNKKYPKTLITNINHISSNEKKSLFRLAGNLGYTHIKKGKHVITLCDFCSVIDLGKTAA